MSNLYEAASRNKENADDNPDITRMAERSREDDPSDPNDGFEGNNENEAGNGYDPNSEDGEETPAPKEKSGKKNDPLSIAMRNAPFILVGLLALGGAGAYFMSSDDSQISQPVSLQTQMAGQPRPVQMPGQQMPGQQMVAPPAGMMQPPQQQVSQPQQFAPPMQQMAPQSAPQMAQPPAMQMQPPGGAAGNVSVPMPQNFNGQSSQADDSSPRMGVRPTGSPSGDGAPSTSSIAMTVQGLESRIGAMAQNSAALHSRIASLEQDRARLTTEAAEMQRRIDAMTAARPTASAPAPRPVQPAPQPPVAQPVVQSPPPTQLAASEPVATPRPAVRLAPPRENSPAPAPVPASASRPLDKPPLSVRGVSNGEAWVSPPNAMELKDVFRVRIGDEIPGWGRVSEIVERRGVWIVSTPAGPITN